jgi:hypothetical protein
MLHQPVAQHLRTIQRIPSPERDHSLCHFRCYAIGVFQARVRSIAKALHTLFSESLEQLMSGLFTDSELAADIYDPLSTIQAGLDERQSFRHR